MDKCIVFAFKKVREDNDLTQAQLAEILGVSAGHIGTIEQGRSKPSYELMEKIVDLYDIDANLFFRTKRKPISVDTAVILQNMQNKVQNSYSQFNTEIDMIIREAVIPNEFNDG